MYHDYQIYKADVLSISPSSKQRADVIHSDEGLTLETPAF